MFLTKRRKASANCPSCRGDRLIYRFRSFNHAYFICQNCGYSLMVFDPWVPIPTAYAADPKRIADLYNKFNHRKKVRGDDSFAKKKLLLNYLQQFREKLQQASVTHSFINEVLDRALVAKPPKLQTAEQQEVKKPSQRPKIEVAATVIGPDNEEYFSTTKAAEILGFKNKNGYQKVLRLIHKGKLAAKKPGRAYIVAKSELERYLMENNA